MSDGGTYAIALTGQKISFDDIANMVALEHQRMKKLSDISQSLSYLFSETPNYDPHMLVWKDMTLVQMHENLCYVKDQLAACTDNDFTKEALERIIKTAIEKAGKKNGEVLWPFRVALTGLTASPSPFEVAEVLGKESTVRRLDYAINLTQQ